MSIFVNVFILLLYQLIFVSISDDVSFQDDSTFRMLEWGRSGYL